MGGPEARLIWRRSPGRWECRATIHSERAPEVIGLNTTMMTDLTALAGTLLRNFRTFRNPALDGHQPPSDDGWVTAKARRAEKRAVFACRDRLRRELADHGHPFLDHLEADPDAGGDSTFSSPMTLPWRFWTRSRKMHAAQVIR
jgi:hypothetical protein